MEEKKKKTHKHPGYTKPIEAVSDQVSDSNQSAEGTGLDDIEVLKKQLEEKEKEAKDNHDRMLRIAADFENYKKRAAREKEEMAKFANEDLVKAILPFLDNLERAVDHSDKTVDLQHLVEGVRLTIQELLQSLSKFGVSPVEAIGKSFDPAIHEAVLVVPSDRHEPNQVVEEFRKGYFLRDRLIRPASVSVSKPPGEETHVTE